MQCHWERTLQGVNPSTGYVKRGAGQAEVGHCQTVWSQLAVLLQQRLSAVYGQHRKYYAVAVCLTCLI